MSSEDLTVADLLPEESVALDVFLLKNQDFVASEHLLRRHYFLMRGGIFVLLECAECAPTDGHVRGCSCLRLVKGEWCRVFEPRTR